MMESLNQVTLIGKLGNTPEPQVSAAHVPFCSASLSCVARRHDYTTDETHEHAEWFRVIFTGMKAQEFIEKASKGRRAMVQGRLQTRPYADRNGVIRTAIEVIGASFIVFEEGE